MSFREVDTPTSSDSPRAENAHKSRDSNNYPISGVVTRVTVPNKAEKNAILHDPSIERVMLSIDSVRKLVDLHGETAATYFREHQTVISTTTMRDNLLKSLTWREELELVRRFSPDYHIPAEYSVYRSMPLEEQKEAINDCMDGTEWIATRLANHSTEVLVQAKGWLPWHFEECRETMERLDTEFVTFYAAGYKGRVDDLLDDLKALISVLNPSGILLIGKQSPRFLGRAPPEIVSVAGTRGFRQCGLTDDGHNPREHREWKSGIEEMLGTGQAILSSFNSIEVNADG